MYRFLSTYPAAQPLIWALCNKESNVQLLLKAKSWQIFILLVFFMIFPSFLASVPYIFEVSILIFMFVYFLWIYAIGSTCNSKCPKELQKPPVIMLFALSYAFLYGATFNLYLLSNSTLDNDLILPFHLAAMASILYSIGYVSKRLMVADRMEPVSFLEYFGPLMLFWFFPVGVAN